MSEFYQGNAFEKDNEWSIPTQRFMEHADQGYLPVRFHEEDDEGVYDVECDADNTQVVYNLLRDELDAITVADTRTSPPTNWVFFRAEMGESQWEWVTDALGKVALQLQTAQPLNWIVDLYVNRQLRDVSSAESYPDKWDYEVPDSGANA